MAGAVPVATVNGVDGSGNPAVATFTLAYDDTLRAYSLAGSNATAGSVTCKVVGLDANGNEDANRTYALLLGPGGADAVQIPTANAAKNIQLSVGGHSGTAVVGFNTYTG